MAKYVCPVHSDQNCMIGSKDTSRNPHAQYFDDPSLTKQSFKDETDINMIIKRAEQGATLGNVNSRVAMYGDFTDVPSYQESLDLVNRANGMFMSLDAFVRERFGNDPRKMVSFLQDGRNRDEAIRLGLVKPLEVPPEVPPEVSLKADLGPETKVSKGKASARDEA